MKRRTALKQLAGLGAIGLRFSHPLNFNDTIKTRKIPASGEELPMVGLGTWRTFDVGSSEAERAPLVNVLKTLTGRGGSVVDSSPMYGRSEGVVGDLASQLGIISKLFMATKVWTSGKQAGIEQMETSMRRMVGQDKFQKKLSPALTVKVTDPLRQGLAFDFAKKGATFIGPVNQDSYTAILSQW